MMEEASAPLEIAVILALFALGVVVKAYSANGFVADWLGFTVSFFSGIALMSNLHANEKSVGIAHIAVRTVFSLLTKIAISLIVGFAAALGFAYLPPIL